MIYLLDVNALVALGHLQHQFHDRVTAWIHAEGYPPMLTCSITELGFVRVLAQTTKKYSVTDAQEFLLRLQIKTERRSLCLVADSDDISLLPE